MHIREVIMGLGTISLIAGCSISGDNSSKMATDQLQPPRQERQPLRKVQAIPPHKAVLNPEIDKAFVEKQVRDFLSESDVKSVTVQLKDTAWAEAELKYPSPHFTKGSSVWSAVVIGDIVSPFPGRDKDKDGKDLPKRKGSKIVIAVDPETGSIIAAKLPRPI